MGGRRFSWTIVDRVVKWSGPSYDGHENSRVRVIVTGSSRLDVFRRGGDSLMGRYLLYRMHPFSAGECLRVHVPARTLLSQLV